MSKGNANKATSVTTRRWRAFSRTAVVCLGTILLVGLPLAAGWSRMCAEPMDLSSSMPLSGWLSALGEQDSIAFPVHAGLGTILHAAGCDPAAAGLQWLKAAAHARAVSEVSRAAQGLYRVIKDSKFSNTVDQVLCSYLYQSFVNARQEETVSRAGLDCEVQPLVHPD